MRSKVDLLPIWSPRSGGALCAVRLAARRSAGFALVIRRSRVGDEARHVVRRGAHAAAVDLDQASGLGRIDGGAHVSRMDAASDQLSVRRLEVAVLPTAMAQVPAHQEVDDTSSVEAEPDPT